MLRKLIKWSLALIALAYLGTGVFLYTQQRSLLYLSQHTRVPQEETDFSLTREGLVLRGWVVNPGQSRALLYFGGTGESIQHQREKLADWLPGYTIYLLAYRGYGASDGTPSETALFADALALYDQVHVQHSEVAAIGRSLGTGVATYLASQRTLQKLVLVTPYDSIVRVAQARYPIFPLGWLMHDKFESWRYAPQVHCPVLILEAQNDKTVSAASTERLRVAFAPAPQFIQIAQAGHNSISRDPAYYQSIGDFLR